MSQSNPEKQQNPSFSMDDFAQALEKYDYQVAKGQIVKGTIINHTSDGAFVDIGGKSSGFLPIREAGVTTGSDLAETLPVDTEIDFLVISEQNEEGQVTLSRRQLLIQEAWDNIAEIAESGKSVQIEVTGTNKGGVVGEVEGLRGFIPRSHLLQKNNLDTLVGQILTANIIEANRDNNKLVLSQRQSARAEAMSQLQKGDLVSGKVAKIQPYGVFVDLTGVTGLLHIKQVSNSRIDALTNIFTIGQEIKVVITDIDDIKNRISLSTKILESFDGEIMEKMDEIMANAEERHEKAKAKLEEEG